MNPYKVLVVDDSAFMRKMISDIINQSSSLTVVGTARNGEDALSKLSELNPDVVTLDVEMPVMDGITTLENIMKTKPTPVVMLSSLTKEGAEKTLLAMSLGAIDFIAKPSGSISLDIKKIEDEIVSKLLVAAESNVSTIIKKNNLKKPPTSNFTSIKKGSAIVAIGTSTGGPRALQEVLTHLPKEFDAPIVIVQHMPPGFTKSLADRLDKLSSIQVKEVEDKEVLVKGTAYIARGGHQFRVIEKNKVLTAMVTKEEPVNGHQPSVNVLFESIAQIKGWQPVVAILTGMGADGSTGLKKLKSLQPKTIAISEGKETCIVYGMPQAAEKTGLIDYVLPLNEVSHILDQKISR